MLAFSAALVFSNCQSMNSIFKEPVVSLRSVELTGISFTGAELLCKVNVENPNNFNIIFPEIDWKFFINTNSFISGVLKNNEPIKSRRTTVVDIPVSVNYVDVFNTFASLRGSKSVDYKIALDVKIAFADLINKVWHLEHDGNFPVLQIPAVSFRGIDVKNISLTRLDFELNLEIENKNIFAMTVNRLSYVLAINNSQWSNGNVQNIKIAADGKAVVPISFSINSLNMISEITQIITRNTDVSYTFTGDLRLGADLPILTDLGTSVNASGTTRLRM
jgi:LEA14-like dessication related protein